MLHGAAGPWWCSYNGIVQGHCLSMLALAVFWRFAMLSRRMFLRFPVLMLMISVR